MVDEIKNASATDPKLAAELAQDRPYDLLRLPPSVKQSLEAQGMHVKLVAPENVEHHKWDGYVVVERPDVPDAKLQPGKDASQVDRTLRTREMVAMAIPEERSQEIRRAEQDEADRRARVVSERMEEGQDRIRSAAKRYGMSNREVERFMANFEKDIGREF